MFPSYLQSSIHWWFFAKLLSLLHLGTKMNRLGFGVKRSKVKVILLQQRHPALDPAIEWSFLVKFMIKMRCCVIFSLRFFDNIASRQEGHPTRKNPANCARAQNYSSRPVHCLSNWFSRPIEFSVFPLCCWNSGPNLGPDFQKIIRFITWLS